MKQVKIYVASDKIVKPGCACRPGSGPAEEDLTLVSEVIESYNNKHPGTAEFEIVNQQSTEQGEFIGGINQLLAGNGETLVLAGNNSEFLLPRILPMLIVDGKILAVNKLPVEDELHEIIKTGEKVFKKAGCC